MTNFLIASLLATGCTLGIIALWYLYRPEDPMLRCKEGDLAVVANLTPNMTGYKYLGTFVTCGPYEVSPSTGTMSWRLLKPSQPLVMDDGVTHFTHAADWCLDPIRKQPEPEKICDLIPELTERL